MAEIDVKVSGSAVTAALHKVYGAQLRQLAQENAVLTAAFEALQDEAEVLRGEADTLRRLTESSAEPGVEVEDLTPH